MSKIGLASGQISGGGGGGGGAGDDANAIHDNVAAEINALTGIIPVDGDVFIVEDSTGSVFNKKKVSYADIVRINQQPALIPGDAELVLLEKASDLSYDRGQTTVFDLHTSQNLAPAVAVADDVIVFEDTSATPTLTRKFSTVGDFLGSVNLGALTLDDADILIAEDATDSVRKSFTIGDLRAHLGL